MPTSARFTPSALALAWCCAALPVLAAPVSTQVHTDAGWIEGVATPVALNFWGVPFAAPPLGDLRWKAPAPVQPWHDTRPATQPGHACKQDGTLPPAGVPDSSEDCLYLNVHVPAGLSDTAKAPVMVWVHGGAWISGSGAQYDGSLLAQNTQSVVVTVNYRLGIFGSLALNSLLAEGSSNAGLMDQQAALRWVQRNIAAFGGNPGNVTIFGESAGSASVCQQLVSPGAAGLFHRAIMESGPCTFGTTAQAVALKNGQAIAAKLNCPDILGAPAQLACLRSKGTDEVFALAPKLDFSDPSTLAAVMPFQDGIVLPAMPRKLIEQGKFNRVPLLIGTNQNEGRLFIALAYDLLKGAPMADADFQAMLKGLTQNNAVAVNLMASVYSTKAYGSTGLAASAMITDAAFSCGAQWTARQLAGRVPVYAYEFTEQHVPPMVPDAFMDWGAYHASELPLIFQTTIATTPIASPPLSSAAPALQGLSKAVVGYWGRFAATGNPNAATPAKGDVTWTRFTALNHATQRLDSTALKPVTGGSVTSAHHCAMWDTLAALGVGL